MTGCAHQFLVVFDEVRGDDARAGGGHADGLTALATSQVERFCLGGARGDVGQRLLVEVVGPL